jgi:hypothetical protein
MMELAIAGMLHEMLHAFMDIYGCRCRSCYNKAAVLGGCGKTGHGTPFMNSLCDMQNSWQDVVKWEVRCGIHRGFTMEMKESLDWKPNPMHLQTWKAYGH